MALPTRDVGSIDLSYMLGSQWFGSGDVNETIPDLMWPNSVQMYGRMRRDPKLTAVLNAYTLPIRRATWAVDPAGCRDEVVALVADDLGLPVLDSDTKPGPARRRGVSWGEHVRQALLSLTYGHFGFERRYEIRNSQARLVSLGERPPWTISSFELNRDGTIRSVTQNAVGTKPIPASSLVWYAHEREGAAWTGQSVLRAAYAPWLLKHELWRVHATSIRRFGMGIPSVKAPSGATPAQVIQAQQLASSMRAGDQAGVGLPAGFELAITGMTGSAPDALEYIKYFDQQMSTLALAGFLDLGQTQTGSRALGDSFIELFLLSLQAIANEIADAATSGQPGLTGIVTDIVDQNWGEDEPAPRVVCTDVGQDRSLTVEAINSMLSSGALHADDDLEAYLRGTYRLPARKRDDIATAERSYAYDLDYGILTIDERRAQINLPPLPNGAGNQLPTPSTLRYAPPDEDAPEAPTVEAAARRRGNAAARRRREVRAAGDPAAGHRQLTTVEAASGMDPDVIQEEWETVRDLLVEDWETVVEEQHSQLRELIVNAIQAAAIVELGQMVVDAAGAAVRLAAAMIDMARQAIATMIGEAKSQGVTIPASTEPDEEWLTEVAETVAHTMAQSTAAAAGREALRVATPGRSGEEVADLVEAYWDSLGPAWHLEQLGGALSAAQNHGRLTAAEAAPKKARYAASEVLDKATCLAPEALVTTDRGRVPAKDVSLDDRLLTHAGRWVHPSRIVVSEVDEELYRVKLSGDRSLRLTWDHPVLVLDGDGFSWRNAGDLAVGDLVVDQATLKLEGEAAALDHGLGESPDGVSASGDVGGLPLVDVGAKRVPVVAVRLDDETLADEEVHDPRADRRLGLVSESRLFEEFADDALNAGLGVACSVAVERAVPALARSGGHDAELDSAVIAADHDGRPSTNLRAVASALLPRVAETGAAAFAGGVDSASTAAFSRAVVVPTVVRDGDAEFLGAMGAGLCDPVRFGADLRADFRVRELALHRAVDSSGSTPTRDLASAGFAGGRRVARVLAQPGGPAGAALAEGSALDAGTAGSAIETHQEILPIIASVVRETKAEHYVGEVFDFTIPDDETFWAEGVLVHNCTPCEEIDGTEFESAEEAAAAYANGGYIGCLGRLRCRGIVIALWDD